jgi:hypothetical protein
MGPPADKNSRTTGMPELLVSNTIEDSRRG